MYLKLCKVYCDNVSKKQNNAIQAPSFIKYFCKANNSAVCFRSITNDWMKHQASLSQPGPSDNTLHQDLGLLALAHSKIEKAVSDLANKIETLQLQETKLADQIQSTSDALEKHTVHSTR